MLVIAADSSTSFLSVAVCRDGEVLSETTERAERAHAERIVSTIDRLLEAAGVALSDADLLAVGHGPGSFTGLRIGVSTMKGLALGAGRPLIGVGTLDAMAAAASAERATLCPMLDARMDEVFGAAYRYEHGERIVLSEPTVQSPERVVHDMDGPVVCFGEGAGLYESRLRALRPDIRVAHDLPESPPATEIAREACRLHTANALADANLVRPVYLRKSQPERLRDINPFDSSTV